MRQKKTATQRSGNITEGVTVVPSGRDLVISLGGQTFTLKRMTVPLEKCDYDPNNPRYPRPDGGAYTVEELVTKLNKDPDTTSLAKSIIANGGLLEPPLAEAMPEGRYKLVEGNRRLCSSWRAKDLIAKKGGDSSRYDNIDVYVAPPEMDTKYISTYIGLLHIQSKKPWSKFARAKYLSELVEMYGGGDEGVNEVVQLLGIKKGEVKPQVDALKLMEKAAERIAVPVDDLEFEDEEEGIEEAVEASEAAGASTAGDVVDGDNKTLRAIKDGTINDKMFYHYWELAKIRKSIKEDEEAQEVAFDAIEQDKFGDSVNVRQFPQIWENERARKAFVDGKGRDAFKEAVAILKEDDPENVKGGVFQRMSALVDAMEKQWRDVISQLKAPDSSGGKIFWHAFDSFLDAAAQSDIKREAIQKVKAKLVPPKVKG